jgi:hypothetical protein
MPRFSRSPHPWMYNCTCAGWWFLFSICFSCLCVTASLSLTVYNLRILTGFTTRSRDLFRTVINFYDPAGREQGVLLLNNLHFSTIHQEFTLTLLKINIFFIPTRLRGTRNRLGVKRDVTRIIDYECVITWQSRAWFLTIRNDTKL